MAKIKDLREAKQLAKGMGMEIRYDAGLEEYRVNGIGAGEATAYYTNDVGDATGTMMHMAKERLAAAQQRNQQLKQDIAVVLARHEAKRLRGQA